MNKFVLRIFVLAVLMTLSSMMLAAQDTVGVTEQPALVDTVEQGIDLVAEQVMTDSQTGDTLQVSCDDATVELPAEDVSSATEEPSASVTAPRLSLLSSESDMLPEWARDGADDNLDITVPKPKGYRFIDEFSWSGLPLFAAGLIARTDRKNFRTVRQKFEYNFHNRLDDYIQYSPLALTFALKAFGGGRSNWGRYMSSAAMSSAMMALFVNAVKYSAKELRPDGSTKNSFPSGHTATAFMAATILHKEYGMTRSPWYSVGGYAVATATGIMRVLNNRHWVSDVLAGAGIGIMSTELGYALVDLIFKDKGIWEYDNYSDIDLRQRTSFLGIQMGIGLGTRDMTFEAVGLMDGDANFKFQASTVVGVEGAYFINKYLGFGGRMRIKSTPIKGWSGLMLGANEELEEYKQDPDFEAMVENYDIIVESDHLAEFTYDIGAYLNLPVSKHFAFGTKLLMGGHFMKSVDINGHIEGKQLKVSELPDQIFDVTDQPFAVDWNYFDLKGNNTFKWGTGLSATYSFKGYTWRLFCDYDFAPKTFTMRYNPVGFVLEAIPGLLSEKQVEYLTATSTLRKNMHSFVIGGSFNIAF